MRLDSILNLELHTSNFRARWFAVAIAAWVLLATASTTHAQWITMSDISRPLVENEPFDLLFLKTEGVVLKVVPLNDPPAEELPNAGNLVFEYFAESEGLLTVPFSEVKSYRTFQQLLVEEAEAWMAENRYDLAFRNLLWVYDHDGKSNPRVVKLLRTCLFRDGTSAYSNGDYELALSIFEDIYQQDPSFQVPEIDERLIDIIMKCYDLLIEAQFEAQSYSGVKAMLASVEESYPDAFEPIAKVWKQRFVDKSDELIAQSKQFANENKGRQAHLAVRLAEQITPGRMEVERQNEAVLNEFPLIVVGVNQPASDADPQRFEHWGARRVGRLTQRTVVELAGVSEEGGKYRFLNGHLNRKDQDGYEYQFTIDPQVAAFGAPETTSFEVAARLSDLADPESAAYNEGWAKIVDTIAIDNESQVTVTLRRAFVRPEALIDMTYSPRTESGQPAQDGVYVMTAQDEEFSTFDLNPGIAEVENRQQHPVVIEQQFELATDAVTELLKGNIDMVDRVPVSDLPRLKRKPGVQARAYLIPTVHLLIPKIRGDLEKDKGFRRGLSHAIDRQTILQEVICGGQRINGCEVISGPMPIGTEENDQISYGYDFKTRPTSFNTKLGQVLVEMSLLPKKKATPTKVADKSDGEKQDGETKDGDKAFAVSAKKPTLVLAHPRSSTASVACFAIADAWSKAGVPTTTRELESGESYPPDDRWDLLYMEVSMEEPLADITRLIGATGFVTEVSAPVDQTLATLGFTQTWQSACAMLRQLHQQVATDLSVIPLWQIKEHFAYRTTVRNVGRNHVHLYQNIEQWRIDIRPEEEIE